MEKENWLEALNDDARDLPALIIAVREETKVIREEVKETKRKADAAWELAIMTREQIKEELAYLKKPIWKKWFGTN